MMCWGFEPVGYVYLLSLTKSIIIGRQLFICYRSRPSVHVALRTVK